MFLLINYTSWPDYNESNDGQCGLVCALIGVKEEELPCNGPLLLSLMMPGRNLQNLILVPCHLPSPAGPHLFQQNSCNLWFAPQLFIFLFALVEKFDKIWSGEWIINCGGKTSKINDCGKSFLCLPIKIPPLSVDNDWSPVGATEQWRWWWTTLNIPLLTFLL